MLQTGIILIVENCSIAEFRVYEMWVIFHFQSWLFSIAYWLVWKHVVGVYLLVQLTQFIAVHILFPKLNAFLYISMLVSVVLYITISMLIAKFVKNFLEAINENKQLVETIKNILQSLPEGVIIETKDENLNKYIVKFANSISQRNIFRSDPEEINTSEIDEKVRIVQTSIEELKNFDDEELENAHKIKLCNILVYHRSQINNDQNEFLSSFESKSNGIIDDWSSHYMIKTIKVKWKLNKDAFMHVLTDVSSVKKYEKEKAINEWLYILFSSLSHEFRTPLNTFCNSITLLSESISQMNKIVQEHVDIHSNDYK